MIARRIKVRGRVQGVGFRHATVGAAEACGVDAVLAVVPYYNKPPERGVLAHFRAVAAATSLPVIVYNIPGRTGVNMLPETIARMAEHPMIVGVKEASGSLDQISRIIQLTEGRMTVLSGDDSLTLPLIAVGGHGVIAVVSNVVPGKTVALVRAARAGDFETARKLHYELLPIIQALFTETNPIPV